MKDQKEVFSESVLECEKSMYALAIAMLKNENDAADVIQESILKAYCNYDRLENPKKFKSWILKILHNTAIDFIHKRINSVEPEISEEIAVPMPVIDRETKLILWEAVQKVRLPYRTVLVLFYYEGYSTLQISEIMSISIVTVRQHLSRGRKLLAEILDKEDFRDEGF